MRAVPLDRPLKRTSTTIGFWFFNFNLEYLKRLQSSKPLHTKIHLILLLLQQMGCVGTNRNLFCQTGLQKCWRVNNCSFMDNSWVDYLKNSNIPQSEPKYALWQIFSSNKSAPANGKKGFYRNRLTKNQEVEGIFVRSGSEFWSLFKYSR